MAHKSKEFSFAGSVYGLAFGDAYGWDNEFRSFFDIALRPSYFPTPAIITDDTQMSLYNVKALQQIFSPQKGGHSLADLYFANPEDYESALRQAFGEQFIIWLHDPENTRAPGINCVQTLRKLENTPVKKTWLEGTSDFSKGCGANMRNPWFGLLDVEESLIVDLSVVQSSVTHNNPVALASSALTALAVKAVHDNVHGGSLYSYLIRKAEALIQQGHRNIAYVEGLKETLAYFVSMGTIYAEFLTSSDNEDICSFFGEGKIAEEALLLAVAAYDMYQDDVVNGIHRLANSGGDSDSIAAIGGAIFGAAYGYDAFPNDWKDGLENKYAEELHAAVDHLQRFSLNKV